MPDLAMEQIKLVALDKDDLAVISAHLQDAVLRVEDLAYLPRERCFVVGLRRFDWEAPEREKPRRRLAALQFKRVTAVRRQKVDPARQKDVLNLLAVDFVETEAPSGRIMLVFSGGAAIELTVECIEAQLNDLGPVWEASSRPVHPIPESDQ
jgi:hypothetical protein